MASEPRCSKPGCGALKIVGKPCTDADCPQQWVHHTDTRPAPADLKARDRKRYKLIRKSLQNKGLLPATTDTGLETVAKLGGINGVMLLRHIENLRPEAQAAYKDELVTRSQAEELLAAKDREVDAAMVIYRAERKWREELEADNAAKDARTKEFEANYTSMETQLAKEVLRVEALEAKLAAAEKALEPFAEIAEWDIGDSEADDDIYRPMDGRYATAKLIRVGDLRKARAVLGGKPS